MGSPPSMSYTWNPIIHLTLSNGNIYKFTWFSRPWRDVLLHNHFLCFYCGTGHREKHFRLELAPPGNPFDFYTTVHPSMSDRAFWLVSTMPILQPPRNEPQRPILLRICFFFYLFFGFVFSEKSKATYLLLFLSFFLD